MNMTRDQVIGLRILAGCAVLQILVCIAGVIIYCF